MDKLFKHINPTRAIDIGAHVGNFTKQLSYRYPSCKTVMIEANPNCEQYLRLLSKPYHIMALSDKEGYADLYVEKINPVATGASIYKENTDWYGEGKYETVRVSTRTLDSLNIYDNKPIDFIKIDVQGSELDILNGASQTMNRTEYVSCEVALAQYNQGAPLIGEVVDKMRDYGFCIIDIVEYHSFPQLYDGAYFQLDLLFKKS